MPRQKSLTFKKDYIDVSISVKISRAQKEKLSQLSQQLNRSESELVREAIMALLGVYYGARTSDALAKIVDKRLAGGKH